MTTSTTEPTGTLEHLDPHALVVETNVRDGEVEIEPDFVASIKEHGVLIPIAAVRAEDGQVLVRMGQRRTLAARAAGLPSVPVYVQPLAASDDAAALLERVTQQIVENDKRRDITAAQRARGIQQLLDAGVSVTKVAKKLAVAKTTVEAAGTVGKSETAQQALADTDLTIEQAAILAEFDSSESATDYLLQSESAGQFEHRVAELRQKAASAAAREAATPPYREAGFTILDERPSWGDQLGRYRSTSLYTAEGTRLEEAPEAITSHASAWAVFLEEETAFIDTRSDERVPEHGIDWDVEGNDDAEAEEGYIHPRYIKETVEYDPIYYCLDPQAAQVFTYSELHGSGPASSDGAGPDPAARKEAERRERRKVVLLNKLGVAAEEVRTKWIAEKLLSRKTAPKGTAIWIAGQLGSNPHLLTNHRAAEKTRELLGLPATAQLSKSVAELPPTGDGRATVLLLGMVLGAMEAETPKDAWRHCRRVSADYLGFLATQGYELSDVEKVVIGKLTADKLYDRQADEAAPAQEGAA